LNRVAEPATPSRIWQRREWRRIHLVAKTAVIGVLFVLPLATHTWSVSKELAQRTAAAREQKVDAGSKYRLRERGFRWISEVPFNR
jgi:hypothetical protein